MEYIRIEHTSDFHSRRTFLKTVPDTSPDCLPFSIVAARGGDVAAEGSGRVHWKGNSLRPAIPRSSNGRTAAFGAVNRGSNPCRGAKARGPKSSIVQLQSWFVDSASTNRADQSRSTAAFSPCSTSRRDSDGRVPSLLVSLARSSVVT